MKAIKISFSKLGWRLAEGLRNREVNAPPQKEKYKLRGITPPKQREHRLLTPRDTKAER